jgi:hypothetical protein
MRYSFGRRIYFKLADESLLGIEELDPQVSLPASLGPILKASFHRFASGGPLSTLSSIFAALAMAITPGF